MDKNSIRKLIKNLISNAIKYSFNNKTIDILLQKKLFKRYKRVSQKGSGGFGIGLDIVMGICKANHIEISLESEVNKGSTFTLIFPKKS